MKPLPDTSSPLRREMFKKLDYQLVNSFERYKLEQELKQMKEKTNNQKQ